MADVSFRDHEYKINIHLSRGRLQVSSSLVQPDVSTGEAINGGHVRVSQEIENNAVDFREISRSIANRRNFSPGVRPGKRAVNVAKIARTFTVGEVEKGIFRYQIKQLVD